MTDKHVICFAIERKDLEIVGQYINETLGLIDGVESEGPAVPGLRVIHKALNTKVEALKRKQQ